MSPAQGMKRNQQVRQISWRAGMLVAALMTGAGPAAAQPDGGRYNDLGAIHDANTKAGIGVVKAGEPEVVHGGEVAPVDMTKIKVSDFADNELDMPYYLANFHRVANAVPLSGERRGWIEVSVWRGNSNQRTYNARVLESQLSLAYFYCAKRPWNPYYGDPAVRARLEAMLERWCSMQDASGKFSEYAEGRWGLAPTAFATKFTGRTLALLNDGPPIDPALHQRVKDCQRKAMMATFTDPDLWEHGRSYSNQWTNVYAGALQWLALFPDDSEVREKLLARMKDAAKELQSPAGYFYERDGPDWGYNTSTHQSNLHVAWHFAKGTEFEPFIVEEVKRFYDWVKWNAVLEPDGSGYALNRAIETRQRKPWIYVSHDTGANNHASIPAAEEVEMARAFLPNKEQVAATNRKVRADLESSWPNVRELEPGNFRGFTPYAFLHRDLTHWYPTPEQQKEAQEKLPYMKEGSFAHLRADSRQKVWYLYVRRPGYYAVFNGGEQIADSQRMGLGLVWTPKGGTIIQNQSGSRGGSWGTTTASQAAAFEAGNLEASIWVDGKKIEVTPGNHDLGGGRIAINYALGNSGEKKIDFNDNGIVVYADTPGPATEIIPVLAKEGDQLTGGVSSDAAIKNPVSPLVLTRNGKRVWQWASQNAIKSSEPGDRIGPHQLRRVTIEGSGNMQYAMSVPPEE